MIVKYSNLSSENGTFFLCEILGTLYKTQAPSRAIIIILNIMIRVFPIVPLPAFDIVNVSQWPPYHRYLVLKLHFLYRLLKTSSNLWLSYGANEFHIAEFLDHDFLKLAVVLMFVHCPISNRAFAQWVCGETPPEFRLVSIRPTRAIYRLLLLW